MSGLNTPFYVEAITNEVTPRPRDIEMALARQAIRASRGRRRRWTLGVVGRLVRGAWSRRPGTAHADV